MKDLASSGERRRPSDEWPHGTGLYAVPDFDRLAPEDVLALIVRCAQEPDVHTPHVVVLREVDGERMEIHGPYAGGSEAVAVAYDLLETCTPGSGVCPFEIAVVPAT
ncbi:hypothetical protein ABIE44_001799 [Marmoricola sp. OAE513]|uniref:hypothetical protein n=1 Tax=Marmoricola sp. OAE513 TaxID=2817894 RepID=UPI001AEA5675